MPIPIGTRPPYLLGAPVPRRLPLLGATVALALGVSGCAGSEPATTSAEDTAGTPTATATAAPAATAAATAQPDEPDQAPDASAAARDRLAAAAAAMAEQRSVRFTYRTTGAGQVASGSGRVVMAGGESGGVAMALRLEVPHEEGAELLAARIVDDAFYLKLPREDAPAGKPWLRITAADDNPMAEGLRPLFEQLRDGADPAASLAVLDAASSVTQAGAEQVDGVRTTRYDVVVDTANAAEGSDRRAADLLEALAAGGADRLTYTMWVDEDDLLRRYAVEVDTAQGPVRSVGTYRDWGVAADVTAPPAEQTVTFAELGG